MTNLEEEGLQRKTQFANESESGKGMTYDIPIDGLFQAHWLNGNIRYEWYYKNGQRADGESKGWHSNGQLKQVITWKNTLKNGLFKEWREENGQLEREGILKNGIEVGEWRCWDESKGLYTKVVMNAPPKVVKLFKEE